MEDELEKTTLPIRVLLVDNDKDHARAMAESLDRIGLQCTFATSGPEGLKLLDETRKTVFSVAWDVNDLEAVGEITTAGRRAGTDDRDGVLWTDGGAKNLDGDVQNAGFDDSLAAYGVSENGIVVGDGVQDGWGRAFVRY